MDHIPNKLIILLSHCLLNQTTRAEETITALATEKLLQLFSSYPIHLEQLSCPEFLFMGKRKKRTKDEWEKIPGFKKFCGELADQIKEGVKRFDGKEAFPLVTIARSPCCASGEVHPVRKGSVRNGGDDRDDYKGVRVGFKAPSEFSNRVHIGKRIFAGKGLLVEELEKRMKLELVEFDFRRVAESIERLKFFLEKKWVVFKEKL